MVDKHVPNQPKNPAPAPQPPASATPIETQGEEHGEKKKKKKRKYTGVMKPMQVMERRMNKAQRRMAKAITAGLNQWNKDRNKSSYKRKDGAMRDAMENAARAGGKMMRVASRIPEDMLRASPFKPWKVMRNVRVFFPPLWFLR